MKKLFVKFKCKLRCKYNNLWFMKLSREVGRAWYRAAKHGIDFGDMSVEEFTKYYCRDNTKHQWYRFFINYDEVFKELDYLHKIEQYE